MASLSRAAVAIAALMCVPGGVDARQERDAERAYLRAVSRYFQMPEAEVSILAHWDLPTDEIPVVLFVAGRSGVSTEALVALRESGRSWSALVASYNIGSDALHVPVRDPAQAGSLKSAYERFRDTPVSDWGDVPLEDREIVAFVNVRVLSQALGLPPDDVARGTGSTKSFVELYAQLLR